ncbi:hypothetical protein LCGC14_1355020 [marine sediment metagenome]|uniref:Uncharacterized protein n=1 Tax=marine sediment metagenome TaxID=412755 RepID=A0A0F9KAH9_9ZZZZ
MSNITSKDPKIVAIVSDDSKMVRGFLVDGADETTKLTPTAVKVYITEENTGNTVNDRDGVTNTTGITIDQTNRVTFLLDALDNVIIDAVNSSGFEYHWVKLEITYGSRTLIVRRRFRIISV